MKSITSNDNSWFSSWFDTKYYHTLYKNRDESEAALFISNLYSFLNLSNEYVLDLACGKGRHSITLNKLGLNVLGVDLSPQSIACASQNQNSTLNFQVHDMRERIEDEKFDVVFNLFTSFGYFDEDSDNYNVLRSVYDMLSVNGLIVIDFMNVKRVINTLVKTEIKTEEGIDFHITRNFDGRFIKKNIVFEDANRKFSFQECVRGFLFDDFHKMLTETNFKIESVFGDFHLSPFNAETSDRLIIIAKKL